MSATEIRIGGFGGQGVILAGLIIGRAAALHDKKHAVMTQSFGPEARGSACSAQVIVSEGPVLYPYVREPDILVVMSQEAYTKFSPALAPGGLLLYDSELVALGGAHPRGARAEGIPATRLAEELGRRIVSNIVMAGFFAARAGLLGRDAMLKAVEGSVPKGTEKFNIEAFERGWTYAAGARAGA